MVDPLDSASLVGPRSSWAYWHQEILQKVRSNDETTTAEATAPVRGDGVAEVLSASLAGAPLAPPTLVIPIPPEPPVPLPSLHGLLSGSYCAYPSRMSGRLMICSGRAWSNPSAR